MNGSAVVIVADVEGAMFNSKLNIRPLFWPASHPCDTGIKNAPKSFRCEKKNRPLELNSGHLMALSPQIDGFLWSVLLEKWLYPPNIQSFND